MANVGNINVRLGLDSASFLQDMGNASKATQKLLAQLDPLSAATQRYQRNIETLDADLKRGNLTIEQHGSAMQLLKGKYDEHIAKLNSVTTSSAFARNGMQQLSYQLNDIAQGFAMGTNPMTIFVQQSGQVIQALQLMTNTTKGFLGFLGGPWGLVIASAISVLAPFIAKLFETASAADTAKVATSGLSDAQTSMAEVFAKTSAKIAEQTELLRINARVMAENLRAEAAKAETDAQKAFRQAGQSMFVPGGGAPQLIAGLAGFGGGNAAVRALADRAAGAAQLQPNKGETDSDFRKRQTAIFDQIIKDARKTDFKGSGLKEGEFNEAISKQVSAYANRAIAGIIDSSLDNNKLDPRLAKDKKDRKGRKDSAGDVASSDRELQQLQDQQSTLLQSIATDLQERAKIEKQRVDDDVEAYKKQLDDKLLNQNLTDAQRARIVEENKTLLAKKQENADLQKRIIDQRMDDGLIDEKLKHDRASYEAAIDRAKDELAMARTQEERRKILKRILDLETYEADATAQAVLDKQGTSKLEKDMARDALERSPAKKDREEDRINRSEADPWQKFLDTLPRKAGEIDEAFQKAASDGLASFNDGIAQAIANGKSLGDVFDQVSKQIIADLVKIGIQWAETKLFTNGGPLSGLFGGGAGGDLSGAFDSNNAGIADAWSSAGISLPGFATGGMIRIGGVQGVDKNVLSINGIPRAMVSADETISVNPANDRGGADGMLTIHLVGEEGDMFVPRVARISGDVTGVQIATNNTTVVKRASRQLA